VVSMSGLKNVVKVIALRCGEWNKEWVPGKEGVMRGVAFKTSIKGGEGMGMPSFVRAWGTKGGTNSFTKFVRNSIGRGKRRRHISNGDRGPSD